MARRMKEDITLRNHGAGKRWPLLYRIKKWADLAHPTRAGMAKSP
jgi:hypothetical protein